MCPLTQNLFKTTSAFLWYFGENMESSIHDFMFEIQKEREKVVLWVLKCSKNMI